MAKKTKESKIKEMIENYNKNKDLSLGQVAKMSNICDDTLRKYLRDHKIKIDQGRSIRGKPQPALQGKKPWNKGKNKNTDERITRYAKTKSKKQLENRGEYEREWSDEFKRTVLKHHLVWFQNTGHLPDHTKKEQIHHIDGDKANNNFDNLCLVDVKKHSEVHKEYERVCSVLIKEGIVVFNKEKGEINWNSIIELIKKLKV